MNILDFLILLVAAFFAYRGFKNGLIHEVLGIVGIVLGIFLSLQYMELAGSYLKPYFTENAAYVPFIAALLIFLGTLVVVNLVAAGGKKVLQTVNLNFINRLGGLAFGILKCGIIISALLLFIAGFNLPSEPVRSSSTAYPYVIQLAPLAYDTVASVYPGADDFIETIQKTIEEHQPIENFPFLKL